jgi:hypothetical protein
MAASIEPGSPWTRRLVQPAAIVSLLARWTRGLLPLRLSRLDLLLLVLLFDTPVTRLRQLLMALLLGVRWTLGHQLLLALLFNLLLTVLLRLLQPLSLDVLLR